MHPPATQQGPGGFRWSGKARLPQDTRAHFSRSWGAAGELEVDVTMHLTLALSLSMEKRAGKQTCSSWGLKNSFQPQKLNWTQINHSLSGKVEVTEQLCVDHGSATLHKWHVRLQYPANISRKPTGTRRHVISEENRARLVPASSILCGGTKFSETGTCSPASCWHYFPGTSLGTLQPLAPLLLNAPRSTWPSFAIYSDTAFFKQMANITRMCMDKRKNNPYQGYSQPQVSMHLIFGMCHSLLLSPTGDFCTTFP